MENRYTNIKVGIIAVLGFVITIVLFTWKSGVFNFEGYELIGSFNNVGGLLEAADVRYRGFNVGKVTAINPGKQDIKVYLKIKNSIEIPKHSKLRIAFDGLIGQKFVNVMPGNSIEMCQPGAEIPGISSAGIVDFIDEGAKSLIEIQKTISYINDFLEQGNLQNSIVKSAQNVEVASLEIAKITPKLNQTVEHLNKIIVSIEKAVGSDNKTNNVQAILESLKNTSAKLENIATDIETFTKNKDNQKNLEETLKNLKEITAELNKKGVKLSVF